MKSQRLSPKEFRAIFSKVPRLCVDLVVKTRRGVVLTKRAIPPAKGKWHLPGGTVMKGEKLEAAVRRVAKEELGISVRIGKILGAIDYVLPGYFGHPVSIVFAVTPSSRKPMRVDWQASEAAAFSYVPKNIIRDQGAFLRRTLGMRSQ